MKLDYISLINKYIKNDFTRSLYLIHVTLVTSKALQVAKKLNLSEKQLVFIEEAAMLHDIGIVNIKDEDLGCSGTLPYICHITEGYNILMEEDLPKHAQVALSHTGVGLFADEIKDKNLPLPHKDLKPDTLEEKIISWADIFYSKHPENLFHERTLEEARASVAKYGDRQAGIFDEWVKMFS